jgi:hypothetical protein
MQPCDVERVSSCVISTALLEYAPAPSVRRRRIRRVFALCIVVFITFVGFRWGRDVWSRASLLYDQRQCLRYTASADQVVFDADPARVALLASDPNYVIAGSAFRKPSQQWLKIRPASAAWRTTPTAMIFLHERKAGSITRLVMVERVVGSGQSPYFITGYDVETHSITPASFGRPQLVDQQFPTALSVLDSIGPHRDIRIYAGQADPADASHFTIRYEFRGKTHVANGYLRPDGHIEINARD